MDFSRNLEDLKSFLDARQIRWALIGGVALAQGHAANPCWYRNRNISLR